MTSHRKCVCNKRTEWKTGVGYAAHFNGQRHQHWASTNGRLNMENRIEGRKFLRALQVPRTPPSLFELSRIVLIKCNLCHKIPGVIWRETRTGPGIILCEMNYRSDLYPDHECTHGTLRALNIYACSKGDVNLFYYCCMKVLESQKSGGCDVSKIPFEVCRWLEVCTEAYCTLKSQYPRESQAIVDIFEKFVPPEVLTVAKTMASIWMDGKLNNLEGGFSDLWLLVACERGEEAIINEISEQVRTPSIRLLAIRRLIKGRLYNLLEPFLGHFWGEDLISITEEILRQGDEGLFGFISHRYSWEFPWGNSPIPSDAIASQLIFLVADYFLKFARNAEKLPHFPLGTIRILRYVGIKSKQSKINSNLLGTLIRAANIVGDSQLAHFLSYTGDQKVKVEPALQKHLSLPSKWNDSLKSERVIDHKAFLVLLEFPKVYFTCLDRLCKTIDLQRALRWSSSLGKRDMIKLVLEKTGGINPNIISKRPRVPEMAFGRSRDPEKQKPWKKRRIHEPEKPG